MKLYTCTDHDSVWPTGVASIVIAGSEARARMVLDVALRKQGLKTYNECPYTLVEIDVSVEQAIILQDRDY